MEDVIRALAETFCPPTTAHHGSTAQQQQSELKHRQLSGAEFPKVILKVLSIMDLQLYGPSQAKLKLLLRLLAYRLPTLLLAGRHCLSSSWPFVRAVPEMDVRQRHAMLMAWARSPLADLRQAYKGIKSICAAVLWSHSGPTGTNPLFKAMGYVPGSSLSDTVVGPPPPGAAEQEEVLASATIHMPQLLDAAGPDAAALQARLAKRGFSTTPSDAAQNGHSTDAGAAPHTLHLYYDAVIVGSGAGGGVTAAVLAAAGLRVLVLEKSSWKRGQDMTWQEDEAFETMYERGGFMVTDDGGLVMLAGSTLGGGTQINWGAAIRPPQHVRQEWASAPHGLTHLGPDSAAFDAALDSVCSRLGVNTNTIMSNPNAKLQEGLRALGEHVEGYARNCLSQTCSAYCNMGCRSGHKQSSAVWLADAARAGAQVLTGVTTQQVLTTPCKAEGPSNTRTRRAVGVSAAISTSSTGQTSSPSPRLLVHAPIVVSSCGAIHTLALLLRSGITVGGNVGANFRLHPATGVTGVFRPSPQQAAAGKGAVEMHKGVSMGVFSRAAAKWEAGGYGAFVSVPAVQPGLLAAISPDWRLGLLKDTMQTLQDVSLTVVFARDSSGGRVRIDSEGRPVLTYWPCATTRHNIMEGVILSVRALAAAGAVRLIVPSAVHPWEVSLDPGDPPETRQQQLEALVLRMQETGIAKYDMPLFAAHQMGSCRMGSSRRSSSCDPSGQVWDVSGLYVADASAFPTPSGVNPMVTIYGVALLTARGIASRWQQQQQQQHKSVD